MRQHRFINLFTVSFQSIEMRIPRLVLFSLGLMTFGLSSCKKFLGEYSQNYAYVKTPQDLDELLVGSGYTNLFFNFGWHLLDDDADANPRPTPGPDQDQLYYGMFYWQPNAYNTRMGLANVYESNVFTDFYSRISNLNTIIVNADDIEATTPRDQDILQRVKGEAHFLRAYNYFMLANLFGKPFDPETSSVDYCVPLKLDPAVEDKFFERATVSQVYEQIVADLLEAEEELAPFNKTSKVRPNQLMAQSLLSRVYLYMQNYASSADYGRKVLSQNSNVRDLNQVTPGSPFLDIASPETIFGLPAYGYDLYDLISLMKPYQGANNQNNFRVSDDLINQFSSGDMRPALYFDNPSSGEYLDKKPGMFPNICREFNIRVPEILLNQAEALVMLGQTAEATESLRLLCDKRYSTSINIPTETSDLVQFVRAERRRELCFELHRWFDLRRYAVQQQYPFETTVRHTAYGYDGSGNRTILGYFELKPYSQDKAGYVLPIPQKEILFNRGALTNEERPQRPMTN